jgi:selenocysteine-specific elongation factor
VALPLLPGDRYVLRESGRNETVGGGEILDVAPVLPASRARPDRSVARVVAERRWVLADELARLTGEKTAPVLGPWVVDPDALEAARTELHARIADAGPLGLELARLDERARLVLGTLDDITVDGGRVRPAAQQDPLAGHPFVAALEAAPFSPPDPVGVDRAELRELVRHGTVVDLGGVFYASSAVDAAARLCARLLVDRPEGFTVAEFRDAAGSSRKHTLPLLARMDETGVTRRRGDYRIAGPRLPAPG